ncbi:MAG: hypothetical protein KDC95_17175, partial [Planctomycetes bacterium]|nr:hypothetical protein [Planctomycetota bacterium]
AARSGGTSAASGRARTSSGRAGASKARAGATRRASADTGGEDEAPASARSSRAGGRAGSRAGARAGGGRAAAGGRARRGAQEDEPKSKTPLIVGIGLGVAVLGIGAWFLMSGEKEQPKTPDTAIAKTDEAGKSGDTAPANATDDGAKATEDAVAKKGDATDTKEAAAKNDAAKTDTTKDADAKNAAATDEGSKTADAKDGATKDDAAKDSSKSERKIIVTPFDARTELSDLEFPADVDAALAQEYAQLAKTAVEDEGIQGQRALRKLKDNPRVAFAALANSLRMIDYTDKDQAQVAFSVHKALEEMLEGQNFPFRVTQFGEDVKPEDAYWNAKCVRLMQDFWNKRLGGGTEEGWKNWLADRRKRLAENEKKNADGGDGK